MARSDSAKLLQAVMDGATDAIFLKDLDGRFLLVNRAAASYIGRGSPQLLGLNATETFGAPIGHTLRERELQVLQTGEPLTTEESFVFDDQVQTFLTTRSLYRDEQGHVIGLIGIARNITDMKRAERELREAKDKAEAAERVKSAFLATMSHEIRTPLNAVIGMTRLALSTSLDPQQRNYLEKVDASAATLLDILNDVLDLSRIEAGGLRLESTPFRLDTVLASVRGVTALKAEEKGLELTFSIAPDVPRTLRGDPLRLSQVLINLVGNAVKFTHRGAITVCVQALALDEGRARLQFSVQDTGIGLEPGQLDQLFQAFSQLRPDISRRYGGTGLGLAICRQLVELMGGRIWAVGDPGHGSTFHFVVELVAIPEAQLPHDAPALRGRGRLRISPHARRHLSGRRVLVVDDNLLNREVVGEMLRAAGVQADMAFNGIHALRQLDATRYDAVLMDLYMPEMDGLAAAREIRRQARFDNLPLIALTAQNMAADHDTSLAAGMNAHLTKPVDETLLCDTLLRLLPGAAPPAFCLDRLGKDPARLRSLLKGFLDETAEVHDRVSTLLGTGELAAAASLVHSVRGSAYYLDALAVYDSTTALEEALQRADTAAAGQLLATFTATLSVLRSQLHQHLAAHC